MADRADALRRCGVPRLLRQPFEPPKPWPKGLRNWKGEPPNVLLAGHVGTGKSMMAAELLWRAWQRAPSGYGGRPEWPHKGVWVRASAIPGAWWNGDRGWSDAWALVIDDWGHGHPAESAWEAITECYIRRYEAARVTILTTNHKHAVLGRKAPPMMDRLRTGLLVPMTGRSRRASLEVHDG